jgi:hypothetical protein
MFFFKVHGYVHRKYILIYIQQDATLHSLIISGNCSTCFGWYLHPSSGAHTTIHSIWDLSHRYCYLPLSWKIWKVAVTVWQIPDAVDTVACALDDGWRYHPKHVEQFPDKINCVTLHFLDIYIRIILTSLCLCVCPSVTMEQLDS